MIVHKNSDFHKGIDKNTIEQYIVNLEIFYRSEYHIYQIINNLPLE